MVLSTLPFLPEQDGSVSRKWLALSILLWLVGCWELKPIRLKVNQVTEERDTIFTGVGKSGLPIGCIQRFQPIADGEILKLRYCCCKFNKLFKGNDYFVRHFLKEELRLPE